MLTTSSAIILIEKAELHRADFGNFTEFWLIMRYCRPWVIVNFSIILKMSQRIFSNEFKPKLKTTTTTNFENTEMREAVKYFLPKILSPNKKPFLSRGSCTYYVITFGGPERPPPLCNTVIILPYPPLCKVVIISTYPPEMIFYQLKKYLIFLSSLWK